MLNWSAFELNINNLDSDTIPTPRHKYPLMKFIVIVQMSSTLIGRGFFGFPSLARWKKKPFRSCLFFCQAHAIKCWMFWIFSRPHLWTAEEWLTWPGRVFCCKTISAKHEKLGTGLHKIILFDMNSECNLIFTNSFHSNLQGSHPKLFAHAFMFFLGFQTCRLGQHVPIAKLRDGILRVGQKSLKLCKENVDDWFSQQSKLTLMKEVHVIIL